MVGEAVASGRAMPRGFQFGTAIAGFQVDMGCPTIAANVCEDRNSDWYQWVTNPFIKNDPLEYISGNPTSYGPGFYELYNQDIARTNQELHTNAFRMGIEWSRIFPAPTFGVTGYENLRKIANPVALDYYHKVFAALKANGQMPLVTINHYSLPLWIHDGAACNLDFNLCAAQGWTDESTIVPEIAKYAGFVAKEFGGEVDEWATLNEPFSAVAFAGYVLPSATRTNPPGLYLRGDLAKKAAKSMIVAHARMYDAVKANDTVDADGDGSASKVGLVYAVSDIVPLTGDWLDANATKNAKYIFNDLFIQGVAKGELDEQWNGKPVYRSDLANRLDYLGVNYYFRLTIQGPIIPVPGMSLISPLITFNPFNIGQNSNYPQGIYNVLNDMKKYGVPMIITETGTDQSTTPDNGPSWFVNTLSWTLKAQQEGVDVRGYYAWTLMDNYEWNHGMTLKFGLYGVNPTDPAKTRTLRNSGRVYSQMGAARGVPASLAAQYGAP